MAPSDLQPIRPAPLIVGVGGTLRPGSSTEKALRAALAAAKARGARTRMITGEDLELPAYGSSQAPDAVRLAQLITALREADGVILASPGYHGGISGLMKNAIDYVEEMSRDDQPYFDGRAVGCIATAAGWQATAATLAALRNVVHALRGWPTPLGVAINTAEPAFDETGACVHPNIQNQLESMAGQVIDFALCRTGSVRASRLEAV
jgi:FMN reductase